MSNDYERACDWCSNAAEFANNDGQAACEPHKGLLDDPGVRPLLQQSELAVVSAPRETRDFDLTLTDKITGEKLDVYYLRAPADGSLAVMNAQASHKFINEICDEMSRYLVRLRKAAKI